VHRRTGTADIYYGYSCLITPDDGEQTFSAIAEGQGQSRLQKKKLKSMKEAYRYKVNVSDHDFQGLYDEK